MDTVQNRYVYCAVKLSFKTYWTSKHFVTMVRKGWLQ